MHVALLRPSASLSHQLPKTFYVGEDKLRLGPTSNIVSKFYQEGTIRLLEIFYWVLYMVAAAMVRSFAQ
jgi:hypothetical protein